MQSSSMEQPEKVNMILLGSTGAGKSATGNTIIGGDRKVFEEDFSAAPVTKTFEPAQRDVDGLSITLFDTVGISDTSKKITDVQTDIETILPYGIDVFLLVIKLGQTFTENDCKVVQWIKTNFGEKALLHTTVLFTHKDQLHLSIDRYLNKCVSLKLAVRQCSGGYHVFNNKDNDRAQVTELLKEINKLRQAEGYKRYTEQDYKETQNKIQHKKYRIGAAVGGGAGGVLGGAGCAVAAKVGAVALTAGTATVLGAAGGAALLATAACAGVYVLARLCTQRK